ncbi:unnamed protein product, partial [Staurois parvus]
EISPLSAPAHCFVWFCSAEQSHTKQCAYSVKHTHSTQVNHLITPDVNPFLPSVISSVSVLFISTDHTVLVSLGMSVTPSQFPQVSECPVADCRHY